MVYPLLLLAVNPGYQRYVVNNIIVFQLYIYHKNEHGFLETLYSQVLNIVSGILLQYHAFKPQPTFFPTNSMSIPIMTKAVLISISAKVDHVYSRASVLYR